MYRPGLRLLAGLAFLFILVPSAIAQTGSTGNSMLATNLNSTSNRPPKVMDRSRIVANPCKTDDRSSETCAAWASADAARLAITLGWGQFFLSVGGFGGLLYSLYLTRKATKAAIAATKDAEKSLDIAERNARAASELARLARANANAELRCYLDIPKAELVGDKAQDNEDGRCAGIRVEVSNFGRTPAAEVELNFNIYVVERVGAERERLHEGKMSIGMISPSDHCGATIWTRIPNDLWDALWQRRRFIEMSTAISFKDVFEQEHSLSMEMESSNPERFAVIEGTRAASTAPHSASQAELFHAEVSEDSGQLS